VLGAAEVAHKTPGGTNQESDMFLCYGVIEAAMSIVKSADTEPWPWPKSADPVLQAERENLAQGGGPVLAPHPEAIDRAAYESFMRGLG
jgi:hypothetical protein